MNDRDQLPFANDPPTAETRVLEFIREGNQRPLPALNLPAMRRMAADVKLIPEEATFTIPLDCRYRQYEQMRNEAIKRWLGYYAIHGKDCPDQRLWDYAEKKQRPPDKRIYVFPGQNPAVDAMSNRPIEGQREIVIRAWFTRRETPGGVELPVELFRSQ